MKQLKQLQRKPRKNSVHITIHKSYYFSEHKKEIVKIEIVLCNTEIIPCFSDQIKHKNCNNMDFVLQQCKQHHQQLSCDWSHL